MKLILDGIEGLAEKSQGEIKNLEYGIRSSIYEIFPTAYVKFNTSYITPDALNAWLLTIQSFKYQLITPEEDPKNKGSEIKEFPKVALKETDSQGTSQSILHYFDYKAECAFSQNDDIRDCYVDKHGNKIIEDVLDRNPKFAGFERNIKTTDNSDTIYRTLGETDEEFISKAVNPYFAINNGCPLFYIGLDNKINYTSLNELSKTKDNVQGVLRLGSSGNAASEKWRISKEKSAAIKGGVELNSSTWRLRIGADDTYKALKPSAFISSFSNPYMSQTTKAIYNPAMKEKTYLPVNGNALTLLKSSDSVAITNRPTSNVHYEMKNLIGDKVERLITIKATGATTIYKKADHLLVAGDQLFVWFAYEYSMLNGIYTITEIEYRVIKGTAQCNLVLARNFVDPTFSDEIDTHKDSKDFVYKFAVTGQKSVLFKGN